MSVRLHRALGVLLAPLALLALLVLLPGSVALASPIPPESILVPAISIYPELTNAGFESDVSGTAGQWTQDTFQGTASFAWDGTVAHSGSHSVKVSSTGEAIARWWQPVSVDKDSEYELAGWVKTSSAGGAAGASIAAYGLDTWMAASSPRVYGTQDWTRVSLRFVTGDTTMARIACTLGDADPLYARTTGSGTMWCDDLSLTKVRTIPRSLFTGTHVDLNVYTEDWAGVSPTEYLGRVDELYDAMADLVGGAPYSGNKITVKSEYSMYYGLLSGNPIIIGPGRDWSEHVRTDGMDFGVPHELGHDFDGVGIDTRLYMGSAGYDNAEVWANLKVMYAFDILGARYPALKSRASWESFPLAEFDQRYFVSQYAQPWIDAKRTDYQHMNGDTFNGLIYKLRQQVGWEPFKCTFHKFRDSPPSLPATEEERVQLLARTLGECAGGIDLTPQFRSWGFPVYPPAPKFVPIRVNSGGPAWTDGSGNDWKADTGCTGGWNQTSSAPVGGTEDDALYQTNRLAVSFCSYAVPNGTYTVNLKFSELSLTAPGKRKFDVKIENQLVLDDFDIYSQWGAKNWAVNKSFVTTVTDGALSIAFSKVLDNPSIAAIEILEGVVRPPARVWASALTVPAGKPFTANYQDLVTSGNDWISLQRAGVPDSEYVDWHYASLGSGWVSFTAPATPGSYDFRLFRNGTKVATSEPFDVVIVPVAAPAPTPLAPGAALGSAVPLVNDLKPAFTWGGALEGATSYVVQIHKNAAFTSKVADGTTTVPGFSLPSWQSLSKGTQYWWRVAAKNSVGQGPWSAVFTFRTPSVPGTPILTAPANGATVPTLIPTLSWNESADEGTTYHLIVGANSWFGTKVLDINSTGASWGITPGVLSPGKTYWWKVQAVNSGGSSGYSATWSFKTPPQ